MGNNYQLPKKPCKRLVITMYVQTFPIVVIYAYLVMITERTMYAFN